MRAGGWERTDADARAVARWAAGLSLVIGLAFVLSMATARRFAARRGAARVEADTTRSPLYDEGAPRLQVAPPADLRAFREEEARRLGEYAWLDRARGRVRIPIARAMELTARRAGARGERPR